MLQKLDEGLDRIEGWILVITGVAVCCIIFVNALMRYIFKLDFYGNEEIHYFLHFGCILSAVHGRQKERLILQRI